MCAWRIFANFARGLIAQARQMYRDEPFAGKLDQAVYALLSTIIDLCLSLFPWAQLRCLKSAVKLHTLLDLCGSIPTNVYVAIGAAHNIWTLDQMRLEAVAYYLLDRSYLDFTRIYVLKQSYAFFLTLARHAIQFWRRNWRPVSYASGARSDQTIQPTGPDPRGCIPLRCGASIASASRTICD